MIPHFSTVQYLLRKYLEMINIDMMNWEKFFVRSPDYKQRNISWLDNFNINGASELSFF